MSTIKTIGIDLGKSTFYVVSHDFSGQQLYRHKFSRAKLIQFISVHEPVLIAMEACCGAHWLVRKCHEYGHQVKLIPPQYVKPYVKSHKNDFIDADAIAEAATRPRMRFVAPKTEQAQLGVVIRRIRTGCIRERTAVMNRIGSILTEFGFSFPRGHVNMKRLFQWLADTGQQVPPLLIFELRNQLAHYNELNNKIKEQDQKLESLNSGNDLFTILQTVPGVGPMTAACCIFSVSDPNDFANGRNFAAWLGLVPFQYSTGGRPRMLGISKRGNKELRELFIHAARAVLWRDGTAEKYFGKWLIELKHRKPFNVALVALANKLVRIAWSVMATKKPFEIKT
ncbi:IS110 family transposase [Vibrio mediterranei]|uniref:IS110 family transposase n=1 Tax=Vibrio mediterranei TaxID=689 RepID=UPI00228498AA|nr:IS110 family transposase [Vibrio mediterranei]MCY9856050.1 IS110 family transposase [Vibrio mediterranei]